MNIRLIRHATLVIEYAGKKILVDPMFAPRGEYPGIPAGIAKVRNPTVDLPVSPDELGYPDIAVVSHLHFDHLDKAAARWLPKYTPLVCQATDLKWLAAARFTRLIPLRDTPVTLEGIEFTRVKGKHGRGLMSLPMGRVSGFVLRAPGEPCLYLSGDTVLYGGIADTVRKHRPDVIVVNAGAARITSAAITMTADDVILLGRLAPEARIVAVHMEAVNHCRLTRRDLAGDTERAGLADRVLIPADGETMSFPAPAARQAPAGGGA